MSEITNNAAIVEDLRAKTEPIDISQYLKNSLGGYSKTSVHDYLTLLRKQQQVMSETFSRNQQLLFNEKENLKKENDALRLSLDTAVAEYNGLKDSFRINELEDGDDKTLDLPAFKNKITVFEEELKKLSIEKSLISNQLALKTKSLEDLSAKINTFEEEKRAIKEMLKAEMLESKNQRALASRLSGTIEERNAEIEALNTAMAESELIKQSETIGRLTIMLEEQTELLAEYNEEKESNLKTIFTLSDENESLRNNISKLTESVEEMGRQNDKLSYTAKILTEQLEAEFKKSLSLIKEKSAIAIEKMAVSRKLEETNSRMAVLELRLRKCFDEALPQSQAEFKTAAVTDF
jgi:chromosome segregation ATPase